jgi:type I restriction enzyme R subunit
VPDGDDTAYQSEADLERELIAQLQAQAYEYLPITTEAQLVANLRAQLETLNGITFSDAEWGASSPSGSPAPTPHIVEKTVRIQEDHVQLLKRDDGTTKNVRSSTRRTSTTTGSRSSTSTRSGRRRRRGDATRTATT